MGYVTTQYHNLKARFVFDIRSLSVSIWKSPRQWLKFNFYNWLHWQIGAVEIMWHRLPSRRPTKRAPDVCPHCEMGIIWDAEFDKWFNCSACHGTGKRR